MARDRELASAGRQAKDDAAAFKPFSAGAKGSRRENNRRGGRGGWRMENENVSGLTDEKDSIFYDTEST